MHIHDILLLTALKCPSISDICARQHSMILYVTANLDSGLLKPGHIYDSEETILHKSKTETVMLHDKFDQCICVLATT